MSISLTMSDDTQSVELIQPTLGLDPYILITATPNDAGDDVDIEIRSGGGVPQDAAELGAWLSDLADAVSAADSES